MMAADVSSVHAHSTRQITIQVIAEGQPEPSILSAELSSASTIADLKTFLVASADLPANFPEHIWILHHDNKPVTLADDKLLSEAGINDGDLISAFPQAKQTTRRPNNPTPQQAQDLPTDIAGRLEELRQQILSNPQARASLEQSAGAELQREGTDLNTILQDPNRFARIWLSIEQRRRTEADRLAAEDARLDADVNEENQKEIMKRIQQEKIKEDLAQVMEENPEMFGSVTMLYIQVEVNGRPVKAFVDSGAQATILSPSCAEACGITHLIDDRFAGIARGVGTARILGRIHKATLKIGSPDTGYDEVPCSFTVMEGKGVDMLLGLDMLKRYQADISLRQSSLVFPNGVKIPFLPEHEIPKGEFEEAGPDGKTSVGSSSASGPSQPTPQPATSNFQGAGRTLSATGMTTTSSTPSARPTTQQQPPQRPTAPSQLNQQRTQQFPQQHVDTLISMGASPQQASALLTQAGGNVDLAASLLFDM